MNKEQLKAKYGSERVLCVRNSHIETNKAMNYLDLVKYYGYTDYRYNAELNFNAKQIIPYVVVKSGDKVFVTKRIQGDSRLVGQSSIGMGGHIDSADVILDKGNLIDAQLTVGLCIERELTEETTIDLSKTSTLTFTDMFIDESSDVSKVHMCLLYVLDTNDSDFEIKEVEKLEGSFMTVDEIRGIYDSLESWSKIAFDKLFPAVKILSVDVAKDDIVKPAVRRVKKIHTTLNNEPLPYVKDLDTTEE